MLNLTLMSISDQDMAHLKTLARMDLSDEETLGLKDDLNKILAAFDELSALDTEGIEELARPLPMHNVFRKDKIISPLSHEKVMELAIETEEGFFKVPRTVDSGETG